MKIAVSGILQQHTITESTQRNFDESNIWKQHISQLSCVQALPEVDTHHLTLYVHS